MNMEQFAKEMKRRVEQSFSGEMKIEIQNVLKNNSVRYTSMVIAEEGNRVAPMVSLNRYYDRYKKGESLGGLAVEIMEEYEDVWSKKEMDIEFIKDWEEVKKLVAYKVIHTERNRGLLEQTPHQEILNLSKVYYLSLYEQGGSMLIQKKHLAMWNINEEEVIHAAEENTPKLFPKNLKSMGSVLEELFGGALDEEFEDITDGGMKMYVLSNQQNFMGAAVMFYPDVMEQIADLFESDLYILPSSVHEVILLPATEEMNPRELASMVCEINASSVQEEEVLGDKVYLYQREQKEISIAIS